MKKVWRSLPLVTALLLSCSAPGGYPQPSPFGTPSGTSKHLLIGVAGGSMTSADGVLTLSIPAGAVAAETDFTITPITNTAPGGQGSAYRLGPDGLLLLAPATVAFQVSTVAAPIDQLTVAFQDGSAYWLRLPTARDAASTTIQATASHLGDWAASTGTSPRDLFGTVTYSTTVDVPFSATGTATLNYVGEDSRAAYYLAGGTMTLWSQSLVIRGTTCTPLSPTATQRTSVAELVKEPPDFFFAINALWDLQCSDGTRTAVGTTFDSEGVSLFRCPRTPVGTPILSPSHLQGVMTIDCGADGQVTGSWDLSTGLTAAALPRPRRAARAR